MFVFFKTDTSLKRTADTVSLSQTQKTSIKQILIKRLLFQNNDLKITLADRGYNILLHFYNNVVIHFYDSVQVRCVFFPHKATFLNICMKLLKAILVPTLKSIESFEVTFLR